MKGRGLLIAAAVIQLVGAALTLITALSTMLMMPAMMASMPSHGGPSPTPMLRIMGLVYLAMAGFMTWVSIKLLQRRRWAWLVSLVMSSLTGALMLLVIGAAILTFGSLATGRNHALAGLGVAEGFVMFLMASPIYVVIGLLIAGRRATSDAAHPRA